MPMMIIKNKCSKINFYKKKALNRFWTDSNKNLINSFISKILFRFFHSSGFANPELWKKQLLQNKIW